MSVTQKKKTFQSYIVCSQDQKARRQTTINILKNLNFDTFKSPDLLIVKGEKTSISIETVREIKKASFLKPLKDQFRVTIFEEAQKLTHEAQNALLKVLEEPSSQSLFFLEVDDISKLLPTIISRSVIYKNIVSSIGKQKSLIDDNLLSTLKNITSVSDPQEWLDSQLIATYQKLTDILKSKKQDKNVQEEIKTINALVETKKMIKANVNPKFALIDLVFSIKN